MKNQDLVCEYDPPSVHVHSQCRDCMSAALAASKILKKLAKKERDAEEAQDMLELANHYENHAIGTNQS